MDIDRILSLLKKDLEYFGADHTVSKIELYRKYQKYLKIWKLDNFETIDECVAHCGGEKKDVFLISNLQGKKIGINN